MNKVMLITDKEELASLMNEIIQNNRNSKIENSEISKQGSNESLPNPKLLTIEDVCKIFGVSRVTINKWKKDGRLPYKKMARRVYFREDELYASMRSFDFSKPNNF